ncbi:acyl carrier protein phosphodiesterase [Wenyingzhuangia sp. 2_MG-2023]|uniref:acyl carrier protein phosphodiesterase n=1 Tax=Wenyingzhuangia sp. 2_MG-2023 TaxID=3062639 RepID=UPI0026E2D71C|nr:acyl carrier protein phosphodiesterase [Wenyingzhuangia sp. 2_MG-2023]MDO6736885.1 acyl carrier protein phosphodiesterase [Wenyingzhuangia sp. 2_MG-2023]
MNFLAHIYLAGTNKETILGNFIADSIQGNKFHHYSDGIQFGIKMHRAIDVFTDEHPIFRQSKRRLDNKYRLYKGVIIDLIYDHFLAKNWQQYSDIPLDIYSQSFYQLLFKEFDILPEKTQHLLPYMSQQNWLYKYRTLQGIGEIMHDMNVRTRGISKMNEAIVDLRENYPIFEKDFTLFFDELQKYCTQYIIDHDSKNT